MARYKTQGIFRDGAGNIVSGGLVRVYLTGTSTLATIYAASAGGTAILSTTTDTDGSFYFWTDTSDYGYGQAFDIQLSGSNLETKLYTNIYPFSSAAACPATSGSSILKGDGAGGTATAVFSDVYALYPDAITKSASFVIDMTYAFATVLINPATAVVVTVPAPSSTYNGVRIKLVPYGTGAYTITLTITGGTNWWNATLTTASVVLGQTAEIWCDGSYWYISPLDVCILPEAVVTNGDATVSAGWNVGNSLVDLSTYVPKQARGVWGGFYTNTTHTIYVSPKATGYGYVAAYGRAASTYRFALYTPQTIWYVTDESSAFSNAISVAGYYY